MYYQLYKTFGFVSLILFFELSFTQRSEFGNLLDCHQYSILFLLKYELCFLSQFMHLFVITFMFIIISLHIRQYYLIYPWILKRLSFPKVSINRAIYLPTTGTDSKLDKKCKTIRFEQVQMLLVVYLGFQWWELRKMHPTAVKASAHLLIKHSKKAIRHHH